MISPVQTPKPPPIPPNPPEPIAIGKKTLQRVPVDAKFLKAQMSGMIAILEEIFAEAETKQGMRLKEVELSVEINGAGEVSLLGTGASLENTGAITLTFTRSTP
ncbi:MAG: Pepco domain-containing protein [Prochlorothrix sp.]